MPLPPHLSPDSTNPTYIWRNGDVVPWHEATVHVNAVGHASVSAVFEGLKAYWNVDREQLYVFRLREHMQRLIESLKIVQLGNRFSLDEMVDGVLTILRANECRRDMYVRPWVFAEGIIREQLLPPGAPTEMVIDMWGFATKMLTDRGVTAGVSSWTRIDDNSMPARAKAFSNYHNGRLAIAEARAKAYDWPILLTDRRKVSEGGVVRRARPLRGDRDADDRQWRAREHHASDLHGPGTRAGDPVRRARGRPHRTLRGGRGLLHGHGLGDPAGRHGRRDPGG